MEELEGDGEGISPPRAFEEGWRDLEGVREDDSAGLAGTREREDSRAGTRSDPHPNLAHILQTTLNAGGGGSLNSGNTIV